MDKSWEKATASSFGLWFQKKYAYESAFWVVHLRFSRAKGLGFWERLGYSDSADVWKDDRFNRRKRLF
ncbi:MAG: hypothetical protein R3319_02960 [Candidatus Bathyarchaeia archaeon]|nr:hypothetical protein [Candidatus Bathyarchaeia archaeon]